MFPRSCIFWVTGAIALGACGPSPPPPARVSFTRPHRIASSAGPAAGAAESAPGTGWTVAREDTGSLREPFLPEWVHRVLARQHFYDRYAVFYGLNPFYLNGHFDSDSLSDVVLQIKAKSTGKRGIAFIHAGDSSVHILGAGSRLPNGIDDLARVWFWDVEGRAALVSARVAGAELVRLGPTPWEWSMVWWNGSAYIWYDPPID